MNTPESYNHLMLSKHSIHLQTAFIISCIIIFFAWYLHKISKKQIVHISKAHDIEPKLVQAVLTITKIFIYSVAGSLLLENLQIHVSALLGTLGVVAIGIGFALQNALANMTSGMFLLFYKPFFVGDYISIIDADKRITQGKIVDINLRSTELEHNGDKILIPNQTLFEAIVTVQKGYKQKSVEPK